MTQTGLGSGPYTLSLRILISIAVILPISLGLLIASSSLQLYGIAYGIPQLAFAINMMESAAWIALGFALGIGGGIGIAGLLLKAMWTREAAPRPKFKNSDSVANGGKTANSTRVERLLGSLSIAERDVLRQQLAESRLAIRHDGVLVPREQAVTMREKEDYILL